MKCKRRVLGRPLWCGQMRRIIITTLVVVVVMDPLGARRRAAYLAPPIKGWPSFCLPECEDEARLAVWGARKRGQIEYTQSELDYRPGLGAMSPLMLQLNDDDDND